MAILFLPLHQSPRSQPFVYLVILVIRAHQSAAAAGPEIRLSERSYSMSETEIRTDLDASACSSFSLSSFPTHQHPRTWTNRGFFYFYYHFFSLFAGPVVAPFSLLTVCVGVWPQCVCVCVCVLLKVYFFHYFWWTQSKALFAHLWVHFSGHCFRFSAAVKRPICCRCASFFQFLRLWTPTHSSPLVICTHTISPAIRLSLSSPTPGRSAFNAS